MNWGLAILALFDLVQTFYRKDMKMPGKYRKAISVNRRQANIYTIFDLTTINRLTCQLDEEFAGSRDDDASQPFISQLEQTVLRHQDS